MGALLQSQTPDPNLATFMGDDLRRPMVVDEDGVHTELSITVNDPKLNGGKWTNIPSIWGGKIRDQDEAIRRALETGRQYPIFKTEKEAVSAAIFRSRMIDILRMKELQKAQKSRKN